MIEFILSNTFPLFYGLNPRDIRVPIYRVNTPFTEEDRKSCERCHQLPKRAYRKGCNEEILRVNNNGKEIAVVRFEEYIGQFEGTSSNIKDRCDLLMTESGVDHEKIVFCDLCCYEEKYVEPNTGIYSEGKRAKARKQMTKSIEVLIQESLTAVNLLTYPQKVCLFAWRDYDVPDLPVLASRGDARANMQVFGSVVSNMTSQTTSHRSIMGHGFTFIQVKYPSIYQW
jgi:hypothetical protein